jgi:branched-chain amino acid transport system substrate-binding protein
MRSRTWRSVVLAVTALIASCTKQEAADKGPTSAQPAPAQDEAKRYDPGVTDTEIKIGQTMAYSGPASAYGTVGRVQAAYFKRLNEKGGINGRKINFVSLDDAYNPSETVEQARKLVEQEKVFLMFNTLGTPSNTAIHKYMNSNRVPHLFIGSGATKWGDPKHYPYTLGFLPSYQVEGRTYAEHIRATNPKAKIAVLYQNDDFGKDYLTGLRAGLGDRASSIVKEVTYEVTDPTVDSQIESLRASGADTFVNISTPKFAALAVRRAYDSGWKPTHYLTSVSASVGAVLTPAGLEKSKGLMTTLFLKDTSDKRYASDPAMQEFSAFMKQYYPDGHLVDVANTWGYVAAQMLEHVLRQCGDDLTRENVIKQAANFKNFSTGLMIPGVTVDTSADDYFVFEKLQLARFNGTHWEEMSKAGEQAKL